MNKTDEPPLTFEQWCSEVDVEQKHDQLHQEYGDATVLLSEYKRYHYQCYLDRHEQTPSVQWVSLWE